MNTTTLVLIRHAQNDWVGQRLAGWTPGVHLNREGRAQTADLVLRLAEVPLEAVYSSPLDRAVETAQPIADAKGVHLQIRETLGETRYGEWTGRSLDELSHEELWPIIQVYPGGVRFPGGESLHEVQARIVSELDRIRDANPGSVVAIVSHADPIKLATAHYLGLPLDLFQRLTVSPASVTAFAFTRYSLRLIVLNHAGTLSLIQQNDHPENGNL